MRWWRLAAVLGALLCGLPLQAGVLEDARRVLASLGPSTPTEEYAEAARDYGQIMDKLRGDDSNFDTLLKLLEITQDLRTRTSERLRAAEAEAGESEAALERLYRSRAWDDLSFALAAFPYWTSWVQLELATRTKDQPKRLEWLWRAKRGFRSTSVQLFRPSLIYGGWLGLGFVAMAEKKDDQAMRIFEQLDDALGAENNHPLKETVAVQLRLLRAKKGMVVDGPSRGPVDEREARLLRAEAFALLEQHRTSQTGAKEGTARLRRLLGAGYVDDALVAQIVNYKEEIVRYDIGPYTDLARAEYAFENEHYYDAVQKYKVFFARVDPDDPVDLDRYRYRHALACLKAKLYFDAAQIAERLLTKPGLDKEIQQASVKLAYVARATRAEVKSGGAPQALIAAAQRFIAAFPKDPDADGARMIIAQNQKNSRKALSMLADIRNPNQLKGGVEQTQFFIIAREFAKALRKGDSGTMQKLARDGVAAYRRLGNNRRSEVDNAAIALQMRALIENDSEALLKEIDRLTQSADLGVTARRALLWARLRVLARSPGDEDLLDYLSAQARSGFNGWKLEQIYPTIRDIDNTSTRLAAIRIVQPALAEQPEMDRRFRLLELRVYQEDGNFEAVYAGAKAFLDTYPRVGDAWKLLAAAAIETDRPFEADRALGVITDAATPDRELWWDSMLQRAQVRAQSTRPEAACDIIREMNARTTLVPQALSSRLEDARSLVECTQEAIDAT